MRALALFVVALAAAGLVAVLEPARPAAACSLAMFSRDMLPFAFADSDLVVTGTLRDATPDVITLDVDGTIDGQAPSKELRVLNRYLGLGGDCSLSYNPMQRANHYAAGPRIVAFLARDTFGTPADWVPAMHGYGGFGLDGNDLYWLEGPPSQEQPPRLSELRQMILANNTGFHPALERTPPCNPLPLTVANVPVLTLMAQYVVIAMVNPSEEATTTVRPEEVLKGKLALDEKVVVSNHWWGQHVTGRCGPEEEDGIRFRWGGRYLLFLVEIEGQPGVYRPANWGAAAYPLGENLVTGFPSLGEIRAAAAAQPAKPTASPTGTTGKSESSSDGDGNRALAAVATIALALLSAAATILFASRH